MSSCQIKNILFCAALFCSIPIAYAAAPVAVDDARTTLQNVPITINVLGNDADTDGGATPQLTVTGYSSPANAKLALNSDGSFLVTPNKDATGTIKFSYTISNASQQTATANVSVSVLPFTLQPGALNENDRSLAGALDQLCPRLQALSDSSINAGTTALRNRCLALYQIGSGNPSAAENIITKLAPEEILAQTETGQRFATTQTRNVQQRLLMLKHGVTGAQVGLSSYSGQAFSGGSSGEESNSPWGVFVNGVLDDGKRDRSSLESGYNYSGNGITAGADYRFSSALIGGFALGFNENSLDYSSHAGSLDSNVINLLFYGTWYVNNWSLDGVAGVGKGNLKSTRHISYADVAGDFSADAKGKTNSNQGLISATLSYEWSKRAYSLSPFFSIDWTSNKVDSFEENGGGGWELSYNKQKTDSLVESLGVRGQFVKSYHWGVWQPTALFAWKHDSEKTRDPLVARFAFDPDTTNTFDVSANKPDRNYFSVGFGSTFVFTKGWSAYVNYERLVGLKDITSQQLSFGARLEL